MYYKFEHLQSKSKCKVVAIINYAPDSIYLQLQEVLDRRQNEKVFFLLVASKKCFS